MTICNCCGTETDMRRYTEREAIKTLQRFHTGFGQDLFEIEMVARKHYGNAKKMLKSYLDNNDHYWLQRRG